MVTNEELRKWVQERPLDLACNLVVTEFRQHLTAMQFLIIGVEDGVAEPSKVLDIIKQQIKGMNEIINDILVGELMPRLRELNSERSNKTE